MKTVSKCQLGDPTGTLWAVVFTQDEIRRAAAGWGAPSIGGESQGCGDQSPGRGDAASHPQAQEEAREVGSVSCPSWLKADS